ncbi:PLC-like phosphodiesterase family protein [Perilla frutescens var. frutescens]|nr:PLC-like phosphodiesterase family protein [Perilla frutescens var. frutescens]
MWKLSLLCFLLLCSTAALVAAQGSRRPPSKWQTLTGNAPLVVARGGFSGLFPDSSLNAYGFAVQISLPNLHVWCDVQLTKDGRGICFPDIRLENASDIDLAFPNGRSTYIVNGVSTQGWFSVDFTLKDLGLVNMRQKIYSRAPNFDGSLNQIQTVEDVVNQIHPPALWLSVSYDVFFSQHNQSMRSYIISVSRNIIVSYVSSPEDSSHIVLDAHAAGLEVFASNFVNDVATMPYNYSYDPVSEYLSFIDNGNSKPGNVSNLHSTQSMRARKVNMLDLHIWERILKKLINFYHKTSHVDYQDHNTKVKAYLSPCFGDSCVLEMVWIFQVSSSLGLP